MQLCAVSGANAIGVISDESKRDFVLSLGAKGVINRKDFNCWGAMPKVGTPEYDAWTKEARKFGKAIWDITGKGNDVDMVFEHPGESTFPVSCLVVKRGGMVVFCAGTTGYNITFDARYVWMRQKRIQGSHFANLQAGEPGQPAGASSGASIRACRKCSPGPTSRAPTPRCGRTSICPATWRCWSTPSARGSGRSRTCSKARSGRRAQSAKMETPLHPSTSSG